METRTLPFQVAALAPNLSAARTQICNASFTTQPAAPPLGPCPPCGRMHRVKAPFGVQAPVAHKKHGHVGKYQAGMCWQSQVRMGGLIAVATPKLPVPHLRLCREPPSPSPTQAKAPPHPHPHPPPNLHSTCLALQACQLASAVTEQLAMGASSEAIASCSSTMPAAGGASGATGQATAGRLCILAEGRALQQPPPCSCQAAYADGMRRHASWCLHCCTRKQSRARWPGPSRGGAGSHNKLFRGRLPASKWPMARATFSLPPVATSPVSEGRTSTEASRACLQHAGGTGRAGRQTVGGGGGGGGGGAGPRVRGFEEPSRPAVAMLLRPAAANRRWQPGKSRPGTATSLRAMHRQRAPRHECSAGASQCCTASQPAAVPATTCLRPYAPFAHRTSATVAVGLRAKSRAAAPDTMGVAMDVPDKNM